MSGWLKTQGCEEPEHDSSPVSLPPGSAWIEPALRLVTRIYLLALALLLIIFLIRPDSLGDLLPWLPWKFELAPEQYFFTTAIVIITLVTLLGWEHRRRVAPFFSLSTGTPAKQPGPWIAGFLLALSALLIPAVLYNAPNLSAHGSTPNGKWTEQITEFSMPVGEPIIAASPNPHRDSLSVTRLPVMSLDIPPVSRHHLTAALPRIGKGFNRGGILSVYHVDGFQWPFVPAFFNYGGKKYPVGIRYRGWAFDHFLGEKKSWRIRFRKTDLFHGLRQFNLINQRDHSVIGDILWNEALRESGIMTPFQFAVHVRVNGEFQGIQTYLDQPDRYFCERHNRNPSLLIGEQIPPPDLQRPEYWQTYAHWNETADLTHLTDFYRFVLNASEAEFRTGIESLLDVDHYLRFLAHALFICTDHPSSHNIRWILDPGIGRLQILPWYQGPYTFRRTDFRDLWQRKGWSFHPLFTAINDVADRLLAVPEYREIYLRQLWLLLGTSHHHEHLLGKVESLYQHVKADAYADARQHFIGMQRYVGNAEWEATIDQHREMIPSRWSNLCSVIHGGPLSAERTSGRITFTTTNSVDPVIDSFTIQVPGPAIPTVDLMAIRLPDGRIVTPDITTGSGQFQYSLNLPIPVPFRRVPFLLGPSVKVQNTPPWTNNVDRPFQTALCAYGARHEPQTGSVSVVLVSNPPPDLTIEIVNLQAHNPITGGHLARGDEPQPDSSAARWQEVRPLPIPSPRRPEDIHSLPHPDGISLRPPFPESDIEVIRLNGPSHNIETNLVVRPRQRLLIAPGTTLRFRPGISLIVRGQVIAEGTPEQPIRFTAAEPGRHWGAVFLNSLRRQTNIFTHCRFEAGTNTLINRIPVTATLAAYAAPCELSRCTFTGIAADDAFNSKYVSPTITGCTFSNNLDAIDIDFGGGRITECLFLGNRDDCIDLSSSWAQIDRNRIHSHGDKGISVGEKSRPLIFNNLITDALMGIAVKDLSTALILNNTLVSNRTAVAVYRKKVSFGPATASLVNNVIHYNDRPIETDRESKVTARFNSASRPLAGNGNIGLAPEFEAGTHRLHRTGRLLDSGSGRPASYYGLPDGQPLKHIGHF